MMRLKIMGEGKRLEVDSKIKSRKEFDMIIEEVGWKYWGKK